MIDSWTTVEEFSDQVKQQHFGAVQAALADRVAVWDREIFTTNLWMALRMVELGSFQAFDKWMRSEEEEADLLRWWINNSGHREVISLLYKRLKEYDIDQLKTTLYEKG